ncbi:RagB/SusD family nutrient uptake outer membrane protein [Flavobacteriaceae bacterium]|nr:RagB/SusD family nutrient uptake outer membrane protein [Flavobacteriaceae bacterium]
MKKLLFLLSIFAIVLSCSSDETSTPVTPPPAQIVKFTITLSAGEGGTVSTTGGEYEAGQTVSVTATPQGEYVFTSWSDGNTNATRTITIGSNSTLTANFEKRKYPLTINFDGEGEVIEEIVNSGRTTDYDSGTTVRLTAVPAEGWEFSGWEGAINGTSNPQELLIVESKVITTTFKNLSLIYNLSENLLPIPEGVDSLIYDPNEVVNLSIPLPKENGVYYYDEVTYYIGADTGAPKVIEWSETDLSNTNRLEYKIYSERFNFPYESPEILIKYNHDAVVYTKDINIRGLYVAQSFPGGKQIYLNSVISDYPIDIVYDDYYIRKWVSTEKNSIQEISISGNEPKFNFYWDKYGVSDVSFSGNSVNDELSKAFNYLQIGSATHGGYFSLQSVSSDEIAITQKGGDWYEGGTWLDIHRHSQNSMNRGVLETWNQNYNAIAEVNNAIRNNYLTPNKLAQAKVLRAYLHWRLLDLYGRIRYVDENGASAQLSRSAGFERIEGEILSALGISSVSTIMDLSGSALTTEDVKYRINQFAALGILAKLYLNAEVYTGTARWQETHNAADYIISNSSYRLSDSSVSISNSSKRPLVSSDPESLTGYAAVFSPANYDNPEIIWSIEFDELKQGTGGMNFHLMTLNYASQLTYLFQEQPWNGYSALEEFYNSYQDTDARKQANFIVGEQSDYNGNRIYDFSNINNYGVLKYDSKINELEPNANRNNGARLGKFSFKIGAKSNTDNDFPVVRLGDVYLMRAEAKARAAGDWSRALADVNTIRARAGVSAVGSMNANSFLAERGREMFMEASRRTDLIRFGKWNEAWWEKTNSDAFRILMPIPANAIQNSNGALTQNPGY